VVSRQDLLAMKYTARRAGLYMRSIKGWFVMRKAKKKYVDVSVIASFLHSALLVKLK
jgi:hypothetical protein